MVVCDLVGPAAKSVRPPQPGDTLGSGVITDVLGAGGMAVVYEIWNEILHVKRAIKLLRPDYTPENHARFETEIKLTAQLDHPNVIRIHSVGDYQGIPFIEMEKIDGYSLSEIMRENGALPISVALSVGLIICDALEYTHQKTFAFEGRETTGLLHRDLKPANILIARDGRVKLTDFGIATPVKISKHTPDGSIVGSLQYIAPEQMEKKDVDQRADIFSFGCIMYEMLTGYKTFPDQKLSQLVPNRVANRFDPLKAYELNLPAALQHLITRCLSIDPAKRPASMERIAPVLKKCFHQVCGDTLPHQMIRRHLQDRTRYFRCVALRKPRKKRAWLYANAAVVLFGAGLFFLLRTNPAITQRIKAFFNEGERAQAHITAVPSSSAPSQTKGSAQKPAATPEVNRLTVLQKLYSQHKYGEVLSLFSRLPSRQASSKLAILLKMRSLEHTGALSLSFFGNTYIDDAEYHLKKATYLAGASRYTAALSSIQRVFSSSAYLSDTEQIHKKALYSRALFQGRLYAVDPSAKTGKKALSYWQDVAYTWRDQPQSYYYREAQKHIAKYSISYF